jgi:hypothetical protein
MSKIVILSAQLGAPQIIEGLLDKIAAQNPSLADWIRQFDTIPIIRECVGNALNRLNGSSGVSKGTNVLDYYGKAYAGKLDGVLKTDRLPNGLGFKITNQGAIEFVADEYRSEWREEINRLRGLFTDAFLAEVTSSILQILGYEVTVQSTSTGQGGLAYNLEGVKQ